MIVTLATHNFHISLNCERHKSRAYDRAERDEFRERDESDKYEKKCAKYRGCKEEKKRRYAKHALSALEAIEYRFYMTYHAEKSAYIAVLVPANTLIVVEAEEKPRDEYGNRYLQ
jgi:hypothetical protein